MTVSGIAFLGLDHQSKLCSGNTFGLAGPLSAESLFCVESSLRFSYFDHGGLACFSLVQTCILLLLEDFVLRASFGQALSDVLARTRK